MVTCIPGFSRRCEAEDGRTVQSPREAAAAAATNESDAGASAKHGCAFSPFFSKEGRSFCALQ